MVRTCSVNSYSYNCFTYMHLMFIMFVWERQRRWLCCFSACISGLCHGLLPASLAMYTILSLLLERLQLTAIVYCAQVLNLPLFYLSKELNPRKQTLHFLQPEGSQQTFPIWSQRPEKYFLPVEPSMYTSTRQGTTSQMLEYCKLILQRFRLAWIC